MSTKSLQNPIAGSVLCCWMMIAGDAMAQSTLDLYSIDLQIPYRSNDVERWHAQSYRGLHHVQLSAVVGNQALLAGHRAFKLDQRGPWSRLAYLLTAGQLDFRFQFANSTMFAHELAHFSNSVYAGRVDQFFVGLDDLREDSWQDVYVHFFLYFYPLAAAGTFDNNRVPSRDLTSDDPDRQFHAGEGLNMQSWISGRMAANALAEDRDVFSAASFLTNRFFTFGYTLALIENGVRYGDTAVMAEGLARITGGNSDTIFDQIRLYSLVAATLSPASWAYTFGLYDYVVSGDLPVEIPALNVSDSIRVTYDVLTFTNYRSFTMAPTVYAIIDSPLPDIAKLIVGFGMEFPVIGSDDLEPSLHVRAVTDKLNLSVDIAWGGDLYIEPELRYSVTGQFDLLAGAGVSTGDGTSLRSRRLSQFNQSLFWLGLGYRFK